MMDKKLLKALASIEFDFDVCLMTDTETLEFVKMDKEAIHKTLDEEIETSKSNEDFANGLRKAQAIVDSFLQSRIDEGY
jgi:hypothetical protein